MILAVGSYDKFGGLNTVSESYRRSFANSGLPVEWLFLGEGPVPKGDGHYVQIPNLWETYQDRTRVDQDVRAQIEQVVRGSGARLLFRPLEFVFGPYLNDIDLPSVIEIHLLHAPLLASLAEQSYHQHPLAEQGAAGDRIRLGVEHHTFNSARILISNSQTSCRDLQKFYPAAWSKHIMCSPVGADEEFARVEDFSLQKSVLFFGRLTHQKGIPHLLNKPPEGWHLSLVGAGRWKSEVEMAPGIELHEPVGAVGLRDFLRRSPFCLFPSHYEPWGLSLNEALAAGRICIAQSGAGGHEEQIEHGRNGFLFDFKSGNVWNLLEDLWQRPLELRNISVQARSTARYWNAHFHDVEKLLFDLVELK